MKHLVKHWLEAVVFTCICCSSFGDTWLDAQRTGNTVFLLYQSPPKIERYDLASQTWLEPFALPAIPTAFAADNTSAYVAFSNSITRFSFDTPGSSILFETNSLISEILVSDNLLICLSKDGAALTSLDKNTSTIIDSKEYLSSMRGLSFAGSHNKLLARSKGYAPAEVLQVAVTNGVLGLQSGDPYHGDYPSATRTWLFPDETRYADNSGVIYWTSNMVYCGSVAGSFTDVTFHNDAPIVLRGNTLYAGAPTNYLETGRCILTNNASRIFVHDSTVYAFATNANRGFFMPAPVSDLKRATPRPPVDPRSVYWTPNAVVIDTNQVVYMLNWTHGCIFRWSIPLRSYLPTIPLVDGANCFTYSPGEHALYLGENCGQITRINLNSNLVEQPFVNLPEQIRGMTMAGEYLFFCEPTGMWVSHFTYDASGRQISMRDGNYYSSEYIWNASNRKMYFFRDDTSPNDILWEDIQPDGAIGLSQDSPYHTEFTFSHPIRLSPDGTRVLIGTGRIFDASSLVSLAVLPNTVIDAAWTTNGLFTLRAVGSDSQIQKWRPDYTVTNSVQFSGTPLSLIDLGTGLLSISMLNNDVQFNLWDYTPARIYSSSVNSPATAIYLTPAIAPEESPIGTVVGTLSAVDEPYDTNTFSLVSNGGGNFALQGNTLVTAGVLDYEFRGVYDIDVRATDSKGAIYVQKVFINVQDMPEPQINFVLSGDSLLEPPYTGPAPFGSEEVILQVVRSGPTNVALPVQLEVLGNAYGLDYQMVGYSINPFIIPAGAPSASIRIIPLADSVADSGETIDISLFNSTRYTQGPNSNVTVRILEKPFELWQYRRFGSNYLAEAAKPDADPDGNGTPNFVEYALGTAPNALFSAAHPQAKMETDTNGINNLAILFDRSCSASDCEWELLVSEDLNLWWPRMPLQQTLSTDQLIEKIKWSIPANSQQQRLFAQVVAAPKGQLRPPAFVIPGLNTPMLGVPAGSFMMGSPANEPDRISTEGPQMKVLITNYFWASKFEIRQSEYQALMGNNPSWNLGGDRPVNSVTWNNADEFCRRLTTRERDSGRVPAGYAYRLPTEAEWEYICRAGTTSAYHFGAITNAPLYAWYSGVSGGAIHPVGGKLPNAWGFCDLLGNASEWCRDWYGAYTAGTYSNPTGPTTGTAKVVRGGSCYDADVDLRSARRWAQTTGSTSMAKGFRVVLAPEL